MAFPTLSGATTGPQRPLVVIPSIRTINLDYLEPLGRTPVLVVDDADGRVICTKDDVQVEWPEYIARVTRTDIERYVPHGHAWVFPQKNPSCKNFGLFWAHLHQYDALILLDDDCDLRVSPDYLREMPIGRSVMAHPAGTASGWINTMALLRASSGDADPTDPPLYARGYPYEYRGEPMEVVGEPQQVLSMFNEGLWTGTPDINGMDKMKFGEPTKERRLAFSDPVLLAPGQKLPLSIMNVQLMTELAPAFYQPPDWELRNGFKIRRHDDVWAMYFLKRAMDIKGHVATVGGPLIHHRKMGDMHAEAVSEHPTNLVQPYFTGTLDAATENLVGNRFGAEWLCHRSYAEIAQLMASRWREMLSETGMPAAYRNILIDYAQRAYVWAGLFR